LGAVFPDGPFARVCKYHDFAYLLGGTKQDFYEVERQFKALLLVAAEAAPRRAWFWVLVAYTYSAWTRTWGWHLRRWRRDDEPLTERELRATKEYKDAQSRLQGSH
jgi:hypothetical protein